MTQQEFYLQAAIQIAAQLHPNNRTFDDEEECNINTYAAGVATDLLEEVQIQWNERCRNESMYGALFDTDPQQEEPETQEQDYTLFVEMSDNKTKAMHVIADNDINAAAKAATIFETLFVKEGAMRYQLKRGQRIVTHS